ncbi:MAG TPA: DnaJ domain-containing protein [Blastocatellia bacterium]|nr:DnaJ domain-containing protein [Blastocatellia bacterium]
MTDLYRILNVTPRATSAEIKSAYRKLARQFHPDVSPSKDANARFARINEAYQILSDPLRREDYDRDGYPDTRRTFYASREAEVVAIQREFDRIVDQMIAQERQEAAARLHAALVVVPLFLSAFYVMAAKVTIFEQLSFVGRVLIIGFAVYGLVYLVKNLSVVLARYTYEAPAHLTSVLKVEEPRGKTISRKAGLVFLACGYVVSLGLGYVVGRFVPRYGSVLTLGTILGVLLYPPIAVLLVGGVRRVVGHLDRL